MNTTLVVVAIGLAIVAIMIARQPVQQPAASVPFQVPMGGLIADSPDALPFKQKLCRGKDGIDRPCGGFAGLVKL